VFLVIPRAEIGQQGQIHYLVLDQFIGRRVLVTVHGPRNPVVWLDAALQETRQVNRRMKAGRLRPTSHAGLRGEVPSFKRIWTLSKSKSPLQVSTSAILNYVSVNQS
jgi:hypothetical protein